MGFLDSLKDCVGRPAGWAISYGSEIIVIIRTTPCSVVNVPVTAIAKTVGRGLIHFSTTASAAVLISMIQICVIISTILWEMVIVGTAPITITIGPDFDINASRLK